MLDLLGKWARKAEFLKYPAFIAGWLFALATAVIVVLPGNQRYLIVGIVGLLWSLSAYAFISTFLLVPAEVDRGIGFFGRSRRRMQRMWFWLLAVVCAGSTLAALALSFRLVSIWLRDYG